MQYFTFNSYLVLMLSALIYGLVFSLIIFAASIADYFITQFFRGIYLCVIYDGRITDVYIPKTKEKKNTENKFLSNLVCALKILLFTLGFIFVSYSVFDGEIRLFALALASFSFFIFSGYVFSIPKRVIFWILSKIVAYICILTRIILYPFRQIVLYFVKKTRLYLRFDGICKLNSIDNINKK